MHQSSYSRMRDFIEKYLSESGDKEIRILEIGSLDINGSYKALFSRPNWEYIGVDITEGANVDIVLSDKYHWNELQSDYFDVVISGQTFEHIEYFWLSMKEISRVLKPGEYCCIIAPSAGYEHKYPLDCWRFLPDGLKALADYAGLDTLEAYTHAPASEYEDVSDEWKDSVLIARKPIVETKEIQNIDIFNYRIIFERPARIVEPLNWVDNIPIAFFLVAAAKPKVIVELGVHSGNSYNAFCQAVKFIGLDSKCYGVDTWQGDEFAGFYDEDIYINLKQYQDENYKDFSTLLRTTFDEAVNNFPDGSIDLLHIDGRHSYEYVKHDFEAWLPKLSRQAVVLFHDTQIRQHNFGVWKFWEELNKEYFCYEFTHGCGLGVLIVDESSNLFLKEFFAKSDKDSYSVNLLKELGEELIHEAKVNITLVDYKKSVGDEEILKLRLYTLQEELAKAKFKNKELENSIHSKDEEIQSLEKELMAAIAIQLENEEEIRQKVDLFYEMLDSRSWKMTQPLRKIASKIFYDDNIDEKIKKVITKDDKKIKNKVKNSIPVEVQNFEPLRRQPLISVIIPVFNTKPEWLRAAVQSVEKQIYTNWELCLTDDGSTEEKLVVFLNELKNEKIKINRLEKNQGTAAASNDAVSRAGGEYLTFLDHDDILSVDALFEAAKAINETDADLLYSDEAQIDIKNRIRCPLYKPDWSPDLMRSQNYMCHLTLMKKSLFDEIGGFRQGFEGAQDYDLYLRASENAKLIHHIPKILYYWRNHKDSTSINPNSKPKAQDSGLRTVGEHLERVFGKSKAYVETDKSHLFIYHARYKLPEPPPPVSIIIPTKDKVKYLKSCIESIFSKSTYQNYEIIILNNNSSEKKTESYFEVIRKMPNVKIIKAGYDYNWSRLNNDGIRAAQGEVFIFLNNDTEVISSDWIERLAELSLRDRTGFAGGLLLYKDGSIQHAGVVVGMNGWADHVYKRMEPKHKGSPYISPLIKRNVLALTGACFAVSRKTIEKIGKFNEEFIVCGSDVEICIRAYKSGFMNVYDPTVRLYHHESKSRKSKIPEGDFELSKVYYSPFRENGDPFYNQNLTLSDTTPDVE